MNRPFNYWWTKPKKLSEKINELIESKILNKVGICKLIGKTRPYLDSRLEDDNWSRVDIEKLIRSRVLNIEIPEQ